MYKPWKNCVKLIKYCFVPPIQIFTATTQPATLWMTVGERGIKQFVSPNLVVSSFITKTSRSEPLTQSTHLCNNDIINEESKHTEICEIFSSSKTLSSTKFMAAFMRQVSSTRQLAQITIHLVR